MTSAPAHRGTDEEKAHKKMPFDVAHTLARLAWHESWRASLVRAEKVLSGRSELMEGLGKALEFHKKRAKSEREAWALLSAPWAEKANGAREGGEVISALQKMTKAAAEHAAAYCVFSMGDAKSGKACKKLMEKQRAEQVEHWRSFESSLSILKEHGSVITQSLRDAACGILWNAAWHAANILGEMVDEADEADAEEGEDYDYDGEGDGEDEAEEEDDSDDDDEKHFGEDYLGSCDDSIEALTDMLAALRASFWNEWKSKYICGVRLHLSGLSATEAEIALKEISEVPGPFRQRALTAVRLVLPEDLGGGKDALGETLRTALVKAEALELEVCLELPFKPGPKQETRCKTLAAAVAPFTCVRGVALPEAAAALAEASGLAHALRSGGLAQARCTLCLPFPEGGAADDEDEWTEAYKAVMQTSPVSTNLNMLLQDGNVSWEEPLAFSEDDSFPDTQSILDAGSGLCDTYAQVISSISLKVPALDKPKAGKAKPFEPSPEWLLEFGQRVAGSAKEIEGGFFFNSWLACAGSGDPAEDAETMGLKACLEKRLVDLSLEEQIIQPTGAHKTSLIYLHGFTCEGYGYMAAPEHFFRVKAKKAKKKGDTKKKKGKDGDECEEEDPEYEPFPGLKVILPSAPLRNISAYGGDTDYSWHDYITDHDGELEDELSTVDLEEQTKRIHALLDAEVARVGARNVFLGGASQGCGMALHAGLTYAGELGGIVGTMGHVLSCTPVTDEFVARKIPVACYLGLADSTMPWEKWVKSTWDRLQDAGVTLFVQLDEGVDHAENEDSWTRHFLSEALKPATQKAAGATAKKKGKK